ncbi:MAG: c-type cytochrome [Steroidobacteraceae bacterium]
MSVRSRHFAVPLALGACLLALVTAAAPATTPQAVAVPAVTRLPAVQVAYLTSCGGCHGIEGKSAPAAVPTLRGLTGSFLCTAQGREFIIRLPDVALTPLSDRMLTQVMNFVAFDLGAPVAGGSNARPYTVAEVARLRRHPLTDTGLTAYRNRVVAGLAAQCRVPPGLNIYVGRVTAR